MTNVSLERQKGDETLDGMREWLMQLERRVTEIESENARARLRRRRAFWYFSIMVIAYLLLVYMTSNILDV